MQRIKFHFREPIEPIRSIRHKIRSIRIMNDVIVFDIETKNFFTDPEVGWGNFEALRVSMLCAYSYAQDTYFSFTEHELDAAAELFRDAGTIVGFSINHYDVPILHLHFQRLADPALRVNLWEKQRFDIAEKIEDIAKQRISLSRLASANLGVKKERHGSEAIALYRDGKMGELREYCMNDVRLTKDIYELMVRDGVLLMPDHDTHELMKVDFKNNSFISVNAPAATASLF